MYKGALLLCMPLAYTARRSSCVSTRYCASTD
uniref:Uncharacterized protein n=1 Tax=Podoviridae sp. ct2iq11 TaxID=2827720 RepID=A0A8S5TPK8_9CAUD|nr:MAG TPA: hypothetical protein [Podoviridae sp. ct2iq11]